MAVLLSWVVGQSVAIEVKPRSRRLLPTTKTLENAIAAPASMGLSLPAAAIVSAAVLQTQAQIRLVLIVDRVLRDRRMASTALRRAPRTAVMSLASIASSVLVPSARPRSAWARAGASLVPSPTIATV